MRWGIGQGVLVSGAALAILAAGCAGHENGDRIARSPQSSPDVLVAAKALYANDARLSDAVEKATGDCMRRHKFRYPPAERATAEPLPAGAVLLSGYGRPLTEKEAAHTGYGERLRPNGNPGSTKVGSAVEQYLAGLSPTERERYADVLSPQNGPKVAYRNQDTGRVELPADGCFADGIRRVYGDLESYLRITGFANRVARVRETDQASTEVKAATDRYMACMRDTGHPLERAGQALADARKQYKRKSSQAATAGERRLATVDAKCQAASGIYPAVEAAAIRALSPWLNEHQAEIAALAEHQAAALTSAKRVLAAG